MHNEPILDDAGNVLDEGELEEIGVARVKKVKSKIAYVELFDKEIRPDLETGVKLVMK